MPYSATLLIRIDLFLFFGGGVFFFFFCFFRLGLKPLQCFISSKAKAVVKHVQSMLLLARAAKPPRKAQCQING
jgi:hypothetical protein